MQSQRPQKGILGRDLLVTASSARSCQRFQDAVRAVLVQETDHVRVLLVRHELGGTWEKEGRCLRSVGSSHMSDRRGQR